LAKNLMEEYTKRIDSSEMIIDYYKNQTTTGLERYFLEIESWLEKETSAEENKPLVIQADEGVGKKTLLAQWMKYHNERSKKSHPDLIIAHFGGTGGNNASHYYAIYKILIRLRENFNIAQKVELLESKLVNYFSYWLDVSSRALMARVVDDSTIILIFDGINMFIDPETGEEANVALWFPQTFPLKIKVIVTTEPDTLAIRHFENCGCNILKIEDEPLLLSTLINNQMSRPSYIADQNYQQKVLDILKSKSNEVLRFSLFVKTYLSTLIPYPSDHIIKESEIDKDDFAKIFQKLDFEKLREINNIDQLNHFILDHFSNNIMNPESFKALLTAMTITEKGLTETELLDLVKVQTKEWKFLVAVFKNFFMKHKDLWKINNEPFKKAISQFYSLKSSPYILKLHEDVSEVIKKTPTSIRKLEELSYHLYGCKSYFKLKEVVSSIENFLLLFNPNNKFELCRYWQILEHKGFDPVMEYSNAIESFEMHYKPSSEDTFMIILQISRFLKEFSDFETELTPVFRHPPIKGGKEMKEIGLRREIKKMGMFLAENWEDEDDKIDDVEEIEHELSKEFPDYSENMVKELAAQIYESTQKRKEEYASKTQRVATESSYESPSKNDKAKKKTTKKKLPAILNEIESLNVDIPENREKFKEYFTNLELQKSKEDEEQVKKPKYLDDGEEIQPNQGQIDEMAQAHSTLRVKGKSHSILGGGSTVLLTEPDGEIAKKEEAILQSRLLKSKGNLLPTFYYYKRWLWMMFPWVTLSFKMNYSRIIYECYSSATKYISVPDEREKTKQALKIAIEAKLKKQLILVKKNDSSEPKSSSRLEPSATSKRKILPPLNNMRHSPTLSVSQNFNQVTTSNRSLGLADLTAAIPSDERLVKTVKHQKTKKDPLFITCEFLDTSNFNASLNLSKVEHATEGDYTGRESGFVNSSMFNKDKLNNHIQIKEKSLFFSEKKFEQSLQKSNETLKTLLLPHYQDSVLLYTEKNVQELEAKVQQLNFTLNDIIFKTKSCAKKLKDSSIVEINLSRTGAVDYSEKFNVRSEEVNNQITKAEQMKDTAINQKSRLESIIKICLKNKKEDELYIRSLNYLLTNFNKMIQSERQDIAWNTKQTAELEKLSAQFVQAQEEKFQTIDTMMRHIKSEKVMTLKIEQRVDFAYSKLEKSSNDATTYLKNTARIQREKQEQRDLADSALREKAGANQEHLEEMRRFIAIVEEKIGLNVEDPKFTKFSDYVEKLNEYEGSIYNVNRDLEKLRQEKDAQQNYLDTLKKAKGSQRVQQEVSKSAYDSIEGREELQKILREKKSKADQLSRNIMNRTKLVLNAKIITAKLCNQLGIKSKHEGLESNEIPTDKIIEEVQAKLKELEEKLDPQVYDSFKNGKLNLNAHLQSSSENKETDNFYPAKGSSNDLEQAVLFKHGRRYVETLNKL